MEFEDSNIRICVDKASSLLREFKGDRYAFGVGAHERIEDFLSKIGREIVIVSGKTGQRAGIVKIVEAIASERGSEILGVLDGARANTPREDVYRLAYQILKTDCDGIVAIGGGSVIDAAKGALVLARCGGVIDDYFGTGKVSEKFEGQNIPLLAIQTASSSAAHLTKYSNITDVETYQKKLIVDESIVPRVAVFQYDVTKSMPVALTKDGALDGISHCWEVWMGASNVDSYTKISNVAYVGMKLIVDALPRALERSDDLKARTMLGLGTDLGGYAIMLGGTNGGHLGSFSLVNSITHGRACAILNPYYTVLFSSAIQDQLHKVAEIYVSAGFMSEKDMEMDGRKLSKAVANGMIRFSRSIGFPVTLKEAGVTESHLDKMIDAAKDPQLRMKLQNMPIPIDTQSGDVENLMRPTLEAAYSGDLSLIPGNIR